MLVNRVVGWSRIVSYMVPNFIDFFCYIQVLVSYPYLICRFSFLGWMYNIFSNKIPKDKLWRSHILKYMVVCEESLNWGGRLLRCAVFNAGTSGKAISLPVAGVLAVMTATLGAGIHPHRLSCRYYLAAGCISITVGTWRKKQKPWKLKDLNLVLCLTFSIIQRFVFVKRLP